MARVRAFLTERVAPIAEEQWERAEFPHHLIPEIAELNIVGLSVDFPDPNPPASCSHFHRRRIRPGRCVDGDLPRRPHQPRDGSIDQRGSEEARRPLAAKDARHGDLIGSFGLSEPHSGSDIAPELQTTARRDGKHWVLNGAKTLDRQRDLHHLGCDEADGQVKGFVVEKGTPGRASTP